MPACTTPELCPVWCAATAGSFSKTTTGSPRPGELPRDREPDDAGADDPDRSGVGDARYHWYRTAAVLMRV